MTFTPFAYALPIVWLLGALHRIFEIPEKNVQHVKQAQGLIDPFPGWVLRMRGLPYSATADDVVTNPSY
jgi:hypothetical protein